MSTENRYQVFVSSTFTDLQTERQAVSQALLSLNHFPAGMELFPASNDDQWTLIKGVIDDSDYYIIVVAARYGSIDENGISFTEREFDYAVASGKPILAFLHESPDDLPVIKTDKNDTARAKLDALRKKIETGRVVKYWKSPEDLQAKVILSVSAETKRNPKVGWVRGNLSGDPTRLVELQQEVQELKAALSRARTLPPPGAELYAQGEEIYQVGFYYRPTHMQPHTWAFQELSWDDLFYELGPLMMDEASEGALRARLDQEVQEYVPELHGKRLYAFAVDNESFETIKVQLVALGLIKKSEKKHAASNTNVHWSLTPYGESYLMRLRALKKGDTRSKSAPEEDDKKNPSEGGEG